MVGLAIREWLNFPRAGKWALSRFLHFGTPKYRNLDKHRERKMGNAVEEDLASERPSSYRSVREVAKGVLSHAESAAEAYGSVAGIPLTLGFVLAVAAFASSVGHLPVPSRLVSNAPPDKAIAVAG